MSTIVFSTVFAYDSSKFPEGPKTMADFFDLEKFPGKRAMRKAKANLEMALMAGAGVPAVEVAAIWKPWKVWTARRRRWTRSRRTSIWWEARSRRNCLPMAKWR